MIDGARNDLSGFQDALEDLVTYLESERKSPGYIADLIKTVRSWLRYNDVTLTRRIKISNPKATPTLVNEQIPSKDELSRIFRASSPRIRLAEALMAFADLRPQVLGNHDGSDGLMIQDLPDIRIQDHQVHCEVIPSRIVVRAALSKTRRKYFTFLSREGCTYLQEYLEQRLRKGEALHVTSPLIGHERVRVGTKPFMLTRKITHHIRQAMRKAGVYRRPYVLRCYAETQLIIAESKGKISHPYLQFIAGHVGDIESQYSTNKARLPPDMIEDMRQSYAACEPFLSTVTQPLEQDSIVKQAKIEALKSIASSLLDIDLLEVKVAKEREQRQALSVDEEIQLFENEIKKHREPKDDPQIIVHESELEAYLSDGWEFVSILPSQKILIRK
jgi:hypothetical protein